MKKSQPAVKIPFYSEQLKMWVISRYQDVTAVLKEAEIYLSVPTYAPMFEKLKICREAIDILSSVISLSTSRIATADPQVHAVLKGAVKSYFSAASVDAFAEQIRAIAYQYLNQFPDEGPIDLVKNYVKPISLESILKFIGIPAQDFAYVHQLHEAATQLFVMKLPKEEQIATAHSLANLHHYIRTLLETGAFTENSVGENLLTSCQTQQCTLTQSELIQLLCNIISAGFDTTFHAMNWTLYHMLQDPALWLQLSVREENSLKKYVMETLRMNLAQMGLVRVTKQAVVLSGVAIPEGSLLYVLHTFANRDSSVFPEPNQMCISKNESNKQLTFGYGLHYCLGAQLAKCEIEVAVKCLKERYKAARLVEKGTLIVNSGIMKTIKELRVHY